MLKVILIFLGAGAGGVARFGLSSLVERMAETHFPLGTLVVNLVGCMAVGALVVILERSEMREEYRLAIFIGVLGGFTTFSAFARETLALVEDRRWLLAGANVLLSNALCLVGAWIGFRIALRACVP